MNKAEKIIAVLEDWGIEKIFGIPGSANLPLYEALRKSRITGILSRHEQAACFEAAGYGRIKGILGVCFATSGPGALNLLTALADVNRDGVPLLAICGQVSQELMGRKSFQEADVCAAASPLIKKCFFISSSENIDKVMMQAAKLALSEGQGAVLIDIPRDVQREILPPSPIKAVKYPKIVPPSPENKAKIPAEWPEKINASLRPLIICGGGVVKAGAGELVAKLAERGRIPVVSTLMGLGCLPKDHPLYFGLGGMCGGKTANSLINNADLLIVLGSRLGDRFTRFPGDFGPNAEILRLDVSSVPAVPDTVRCDMRDFLKKLINLVIPAERPGWNDIKRLGPVRRRISSASEFGKPPLMLANLNDYLSKDVIIVTDVGQHQIWSALNLDINRAYSFMTSGGMGTMGFGLPTAIGAALAGPDKSVICVSGDGSLLMNLQELALLSELGLNVKVLLFDNRSLGLVRQQQTILYDRQYSGCDFGPSLDYLALAKAFSIPAYYLNAYNCKKIMNNIGVPGPEMWIYPLSRDLLALPELEANILGPLVYEIDKEMENAV